MPLFFKLSRGGLKGCDKLSNHLNNSLKRLIRDVEIAQFSLIRGAKSIGLTKSSKCIQPVWRMHFRMCFIFAFMGSGVSQGFNVWEIFIKPLTRALNFFHVDVGA